MRLERYEPLSIPFVLHLHRLIFSHVDGRGGHLKSKQNLIVSYESARHEIVFTPPDENETPQLLSELLVRYAEAKQEGRTHPIVLIGAFVLDFLAIHPVADGNGRLAGAGQNHYGSSSHSAAQAALNHDVFFGRRSRR
jgi:Fic family protein